MSIVAKIQDCEKRGGPLPPQTAITFNKIFFVHSTQQDMQHKLLRHFNFGDGLHPNY